MKKAVLYIFVTTILTFSSCQYFQKPSMSEDEIALLKAQNDSLKDIISSDSQAYERQISQLRNSYEQQLTSLQQEIEEGRAQEKDVYYVVVGSFKNLKYAETYSDKIKVMGYEGKIVDGPNDFNLVTSGTFKTLNASLSALNEARSKVASEAWIYFND